MGLLVLASIAVMAEGVKLTFNDEFNSLNGENWDVISGDGCRYGICSWGNDELQSYSAGNVAVEDGNLVITARLESTETASGTWYTSGRVQSAGKASFQYGRIEASMQLPSGAGLWPAFWMLPTEPNSYGTWAASGELDIMEAVNDMTTIYGSTHFGGPFPKNLYAGCQLSPNVDFSLGYHLYAIEWSEDEIKWFVDNQLYCQRTYWSSTAGDYPAPFNAPFRILFNLAIGGAITGISVGGVNDSALPAKLLVDYVRVYDLTDDVVMSEPFAGRPACIPGTIEAEKYDAGGEDVAFHDVDPDTNWGAAFRPDGADVASGDSSSGGYYLSAIYDGEWTAYSLHVQHAGSYSVTLRAAAPADGSTVQLVLDASDGCLVKSQGGDGAALGAAVDIPSTGGYDTWMGVSGGTVQLPAGLHLVKACFSGANNTMLLDSITLRASSLGGGGASSSSSSSSLADLECVAAGSTATFPLNTAFGGGPWGIPGTIEAEMYDEGGPMVSFSDADLNWNRGNSNFRPSDGVDIVERAVGGSHGDYVSYFNPGEFLKYTAWLAEAGQYHVVLSVASGAAEGSKNSFRLLVNASDCSQTLPKGARDLTGGGYSFKPTGGWETFTEVEMPRATLPAGTQSLIFCPDSSDFNLDYMRFASVAAPSPAPGASSSDPASLSTGAIVGIAVGVSLCVAAVVFRATAGPRRQRREKRARAKATKASVAAAAAAGATTAPAGTEAERPGEREITAPLHAVEHQWPRGLTSPIPRQKSGNSLSR